MPRSPRAVAILAGVTAVTAVLVLAVVVPAQPSDDEAPAVLSPPAPQATTRTAPLTLPVGRYVALGDSFTAGPLIPYVEATPARCLRSSANYPAVLGRWLAARRVVDASCSGADTRDLVEQRSALTTGTDLVTVGMGGNDFDIFGTLANRCTAVAADDLLGSPCRAEFTSAAGRDEMVARARRVAGRLAAGLRGIARLAPNAVVAVVGYPRIVPAAGTCAALPFARADYRWTDRVQRALNGALRRAAAGSQALYVDTYTRSLRHNVCAGTDAWVNGRTTLAARALAFHPFAAGMRATAAAALSSLTGAEPTAVMVRHAQRESAVRPRGALTLREQRIIAALFAGA